MTFVLCQREQRCLLSIYRKLGETKTHGLSDAPLAVPRKENDKSFLGGEHSAVQRFALGSNRVSILMSTSRETFRV